MSDRSLKYKDGNPTFIVSGSSDDYYISRHSTAAQERGQEWSCNCMSWIIMRKMPCKHLKADARVVGPIEVPDQGEGSANFRLADENRDRPPAILSTPFSEAEMEIGRQIRNGGFRHGFQLCHEFSKSVDHVQGWVAEIKYDGQLAMMIDGRIIARSLNDITERFPEIIKVDDAVIIGEICVLDEAGYSDFNKVLQRKRDRGIRIASLEMPATFIAFDILEATRGNMRREDLTALPFSERRKRLEAYFEARKGVLDGWKIIEQLPIYDNDQVEGFRQAAAQYKSEGWILKDPNAPHKAKRTRAFLKVKTWKEQDFTVIALKNTTGEKGNPGMVATINTGEGGAAGREQEVNIGGHSNQAQIAVGKTITVKFLSRSEDGALRFPTLKQIRGEDRN